MDTVSTSSNKSSLLSSEDNTNNVSSPKGFISENPKIVKRTKQVNSSQGMNTSLKERIYSARQHLLSIEKKKQIIDQRQVIFNIW